MSARLPNGIKIHVATTLEAAKAISGISNQNPAVATSASNGYENGNVILLNSGWNGINESVFRLIDVAAGSFKLEGVDATDLIQFPAGTGGGSARRATGWTEVQQVMESTTEGGEQQYTTFSYLDEDIERRLPSTKSAMGVNLSIADDPSLPGYAVLKAASRDRQARVVRITLPGGGFLFYNAIISFNEIPTMTKGSVMACAASLSLQGLPTRYTT